MGDHLVRKRKGSKMQLVDSGRCDRCEKSREVVRLIQKDDSGANGPYVILCRECLAYSWNSLDSGRFPDRELNEVKKG